MGDFDDDALDWDLAMRTYDEMGYPYKGSYRKKYYSRPFYYKPYWQKTSKEKFDYFWTKYCRDPKYDFFGEDPGTPFTIETECALSKEDISALEENCMGRRQWWVLKNLTDDYYLKYDTLFQEGTQPFKATCKLIEGKEYMISVGDWSTICGNHHASCKRYCYVRDGVLHYCNKMSELPSRLCEPVTRTEVALKPCPFCKSDKVHFGKEEGKGPSEILCPDCGLIILGTRPNVSHVELADKYNRRDME